MAQIAVLMTCHNRRALTVACLRALFDSKLSGDNLHVILTDDGSTDGTTDAVRVAFPDVEILSGNGSLYWNNGMRRAFDVALRRNFDFYLWLNDDTRIFPDTIERMLDTFEIVTRGGSADAIIVGSTRDPETGATSYGGQTRPNRRSRPLYLSLVEPTNVPQRCETMHGNLVLIPRAVAERVGNLDPAFAHAMGDTDYGLRAGKSGASIWVMPGHGGTCSANHGARVFYDKSLGLRARLKLVAQPKALPLRSWMTLTRRYAGPAWPVVWAWPYLRVLFGGVTRGPSDS